MENRMTSGTNFKNTKEKYATLEWINQELKSVGLQYNSIAPNDKVTGYKIVDKNYNVIKKLRTLKALDEYVINQDWKKA